MPQGATLAMDVEQIEQRARGGDHDGAMRAILLLLAARTGEEVVVDAVSRIAVSAPDRARGADLLERACALLPSHAGLRGNLGVLYRKLGRDDDAQASYATSLALSPDQPLVLCNLGRLHRDLGRLGEAVVCFHRAAMLPDGTAQAWSLLSNALREAGRLDDARRAAERAVVVEPSLGEAHLNHGAACHMMGRIPDAIVSYVIASRLEPSAAAERNLSGAVARFREESGGSPLAEGALDWHARPFDAQAKRAFVELLGRAQRPGALAGALHVRGAPAEEAWRARTLGTALHRLGHKARAERFLREAIALGRDAESRASLALLLIDQARIEEAHGELALAIAIDPDHGESLKLLGILATNRGHAFEGARLLRRAAERAPESLEVAVHLARALRLSAAHDEAAPLYERILSDKGGRDDFWSTALFGLHFDSRITPEALFERHRAFGATFGDPERRRWPSVWTDKTRGRRLRVGYVSPDFTDHPVSYFFEPVLAHHDRGRFEIACYSYAGRPDDVTRRLSGMCDLWRDIATFDDERVASLVRDDRIDILVDLAGHTGRSRLMVFAKKPAPVQASWLGYFNTTGLSAIDYRIADRASVTEQAERLFVERIVCLPRSANCFLPVRGAPDVSPAPHEANGFVTYGCFNNAAKVSRDVVATFARVLRRVPSSRLIHRYSTFDDKEAVAQYRRWYRDEGIAEGRIEFRGRAPLGRFLEAFGTIDVGLDPFPYSGETTALHTLWMGVPFVGLEGETLVERLGTRVLRLTGLDDWVASSKDEYVERAVRAASERPPLSALRAALRDRVRASPLMDHEGVTRDLEAAYLDMWERWCATP